MLQKAVKSIKTQHKFKKNMKICEAVWEYGSSKPLAMQKRKKSVATVKVATFFCVSLGGTSKMAIWVRFFIPVRRAAENPPETSHPGDAGGRLSENHKKSKK
jgi:hypothetical protein